MEEKQLDTETETTNVDTDAETNDVDFSNMSDEEFLEFISKEENEEEKEKEKEVTKDEKNTSNTNTDTETDTEQPSDTETDTDTTVKEENTDDSLDISQEDKDLLKQVFNEGFKAKGKIIKPKNLQEFLSLAQQGVDYNIKNREINNSKRQLQSLTNAGITSLEDLNFALDLYKGDVEAVKKLIKDKGIEVYNLDLEEDSKYNPNTNSIASNSSVEFNDIISSIKDKPYYNDVQDIVLEKWDEESRQILLSNNDLFRRLTEEFELDRFNTITELIENERAFGRLKGMNDLYAYIKVVTDYEEQQNKKQEEQKIVKPIEKSKDIDVSKKAITQTKGADSSKPAKKVYSDEELAKLSDEEYMKLYNSGELN